jgi:hypothetical protein
MYHMTEGVDIIAGGSKDDAVFLLDEEALVDTGGCQHGC